MKKTLVALVLLLAVLFVCSTALAADKFVFAENNITIFEGDTLQAELVREGRFAEEGGTLTYAVANGGRNLSISEDGTMTALNRGEATITCVIKYDSGLSKKCSATVKIARRVTSVVTNRNRLNVFEHDDGRVLELLQQDTEYPIVVIPVGKNVELYATALPEDASNRRILYETTDTAVAIILQGTELKGTKVGECDLRVYSKQNPEVEEWFHLIVVQPVNKVTITGGNSKRVVLVGNTLQLEASCEPANASLKEVRWTSDNTDVATVDEYGMVTGLRRGSVTVKAIAADGSGRAGTVTVVVQQGPESVTLRNSEETIDVGVTKRFTATVLPSSTNNQNVVWTSSDPSVATVTANGSVKGISVGSCELTCTCDADDSVYTTMTLNVQQPVTRVVFTENSTTVDAGASVNVSWNVFPDTATNPAVTLKSSNERIAVVDQSGRVTGLQKGTVKIIATSADGSNKSASITVKVTQPVTGVYFRQDLYHVPYGEYLTIHAFTEPKDADNQSMTWYTDDPYISTVNKATTNSNYNSFYGRHMGTTMVRVTTEDGGYSASSTIVVDRYDDPVAISDLYLNANRIKINLRNISNMNLTRIYFEIQVYGLDGLPLAVTSTGSNVITGYYLDELGPNEISVHGRFHFDDFIQPEATIGGLIMHITSYKTDEVFMYDGKAMNFGRTINENLRPEGRYPAHFVPVTITPEPAPETTPEQAENNG